MNFFIKAKISLCLFTSTIFYIFSIVLAYGLRKPSFVSIGIIVSLAIIGSIIMIEGINEFCWLYKGRDYLGYVHKINKYRVRKTNGVMDVNFVLIIIIKKGKKYEKIKMTYNGTKPKYKEGTYVLLRSTKSITRIIKNVDTPPNFQKSLI